MGPLDRLLDRLLDLLLPARCPCCGSPARGPCPPCAAALPAAPALAPPPGLDSCHAAVAYRDGGRALVATVKFRGDRTALPWIASVLAGRVPVDDLDVVTWVPTLAAHRRRRGGDQAERIARAVGRATGLPVRSLLVRRAGPPQAGRGAAARRAGPALAARGPVNGRVLVVDDVVTTGGSVAAAARALRAAGATAVRAAAVARTPGPRPPDRGPGRSVTDGGANGSFAHSRW